MTTQPHNPENSELNKNENPFDGNRWIKPGLSWGLFMYVFSVILYPYWSGESLTLTKAWIGIPIWALFGLGFGYTLKLKNRKKKEKH